MGLGLIMNEQKKYILSRLAELLRIDIFCQSEGTLVGCQRNSKLNPIFSSKQLRQKLMKEADGQNLPLLHKEEDSIYFICVRSEGQYYFAGPLSLGVLNKVELHKYYKRYGIHTDKEKILKRFQFSEVMDIAQIMDAVLNENTTEDMADRPEGTALCTEHSMGALSEAAFHRGKWSWCYGQAGAGC